MKISTRTRTATLALAAATLLLTAPPVFAQDEDHEAHHPDAADAPTAVETAPATMGSGMMGRGMMNPDMMQQMMMGMMQEGEMDPGTMRGMMEERGMRPGMMGPQTMHGMMESMMRGMAEGLARGLVEGAVRAHGMGPDTMRAHGMMRGVGIGPLVPRGMQGEFSIERVRAIVEGHLAWHGNPRLRLGEVAEHDDGTITAEIETVDGSLVQRLTVDPSGRMMRAD